MLSYLHRHIVPAAYDVLPPGLQSPQADAMLLAIALQESACVHRKQVKGPAKGFWQFEAGGGVKGVLTHPASSQQARTALVALCYSGSLTVPQIHTALEHNDVLACVFARLLLYTLPSPLPLKHQAKEGWRQYISAWRPGKPHPDTWDGHYARAWSLVQS